MSAEGDFGVVAIVGVGLIGGSLGMALRRRGLSRSVVGVGRSPERLAKAVALGAIDVFDTDTPRAVSEADLVILCTPVSRIIADMGIILSAARPDAAITDVGSVKSAIVAAAGGDPRFVGSHPMAGSEMTGVEAARATLFQEATWAVTPHPGNPPQTVERVHDLAQSVGSAVHVMPPDVHDSAVAITSHLPHVMAAAFMRMAAEGAAKNEALAYMTAGSFADATRVAASSPGLWRDICLTNSDAVLAAIDSLSAQLAAARDLIASGDSESLHAYFAESSRAKSQWPNR